MYCIKCGVELADSEKSCPLCGTVVFHPDFPAPDGDKLYPVGQRPPQQVSPLGARFILTMCFVAALLIPTLCDVRIHGAVTWSGYVIGALALGYVWLVLPFWFRRPSPIIFVPCGFAAAAVYLLYIDLVTPGAWFLTFGLPVVGAFGGIITAVVVLVRCLGRGRLFIFGGAAMATGIFMPVMEWLLTVTFPLPFYGWSLYPLAVLALMGITMIVIGLCRPMRETLERKFFI